jgi:DNA-binding transcriptional MerR regulator
MAKSETEGGRRAVERRGEQPTHGRQDREAGAESSGTVAELLDGGKLYYRIGEVSRITGVKPYVLRYWETEFRWMSPQKSRSKQRLYRPKNIETILLIKKLLYKERYTIAGARKKVRDLVAAGAVQDWLREGSDGKSLNAPRRRDGESDAAGDDSPLDLVRGLREELRSIRELLGT